MGTKVPTATWSCVVYLLARYASLSVCGAAEDAIAEAYRLMRSGKADEAVAKLLDLPATTETLHALGRAQYYAKSYQMGIDTLERCLEMRPQPVWMTGWSYYFIGRCHQERGNRSKAKEWYRKAIELNATRNCTSAARQALGQVAPGEKPPRTRAPKRPGTDGKGRMFGKAAPGFQLKGAYGETYSLSQLKGGPLVLQFGSSW